MYCATFARHSRYRRAPTQDDPYSELDDDAAAERSELQCHEPSVSVYCIQGHRQYMEDRYDIAKVAAAELQLKLYAVYDGHGGSVSYKC